MKTCANRPRGRSISSETQRILWATSAGYCQKPECNREVIVEIMNGKYASLGEMAHIVAASGGGPRADETASDDRLVHVDNLILLCPTCHTLIDKCPEDFTPEDIMGWKRRHSTRRRAIFGVVEVASREELRAQLEKFLRHNNAIHRAYGPESEAAEDPMSDAHELWLREAVRSIIPNNRKIIELLDTNSNLLRETEKEALARLRLHADAFEARHLFGDVNASAPRFPPEVDSIGKD